MDTSYCPDCQLLAEGACPMCGGKTRAPIANAPVLLAVLDPVRAAMLEPLLDEEKIPYSKVGRLGAAMVMRAGAFMESYRFFVPYGALERALPLIEAWREDVGDDGQIDEGEKEDQ